MPNPLAGRFRLTSLLLLALVGTWLGHAMEYGLVAGWHGLSLGLSGPLHSYMLPLAAGLALGSLLLARRLSIALRLARRQYHVLWHQLRRGVRTGAAVPAAPPRSSEPHGIGLFLAVAAAQIGLYLFQENLEAALGGAPPPGLGAVSGTHWAAPLVQLALAAWLTLGWLACSRFLRRRQDAVARLGALIHAIGRGRRSGDAVRLPADIAVARTWSSRPRAARAPPPVLPA